MSEQTAAAKNEDTQAGMRLNLRQVFADDISVEVPNAPQVFVEQPEFKINITVNPSFETLEVADHYAARLRITVAAQTADDKTVYLVEVQQSGVFEIAGFNEAQKHHILHVYCPIHLFPYAREAIGNLVSRTGFPPLLLPQFDFDALYRERIEMLQKEAENNQESDTEEKKD